MSMREKKEGNKRVELSIIARHLTQDVPLLTSTLAPGEQKIKVSFYKTVVKEKKALLHFPEKHQPTVVLNTHMLLHLSGWQSDSITDSNKNSSTCKDDASKALLVLNLA